MFGAIETIARDHQHTIQALIALGTLSAVIVALLTAYMSHRMNRTRLTAYARTCTIIHDLIPIDQRPLLFSVDITNKGNLPLRIPFSFFEWKLPLKRGAWMPNPLDFFGDQELAPGMPLPQKKYPVEIAPRASQTFYVSHVAGLEQNIVEMKASLGWFRKWWASRYVKAFVLTDDGTRVRATISKQVKDMWRQ